MRSVEAWKRKKLKDPKFKAAYDAQEEEFALASKKIEAREKAAITNKRTGRSTSNPTRHSK